MAEEKGKKPATIWEVTILALMIGLVIAIQYASPFFNIPQGQFVRTYSSGSASFNSTTVVSGIGGNFSSNSYSLKMIAGDTSGFVSSQSYNLFLGSGQLIYATTAVIGPPQFFEQTSTPTNPEYAQFQTYQFSTKILGQEAISYVKFDLYKSGALYASYTLGNGIIKQQNDVYSLSFSELPAGSYSYQWYAKDISARESTDSPVSYIINKANPKINLTFDNAVANITISKGATINIKATSVNPALDIILTTNGGDLVSNKNSVQKSFVSSSYDIGPYLISASVTGNENWSSQSVTNTINVVSAFLNNTTTSSPNGTEYISGQIYRFYAEISGNISDVIFEFNGVNYSYIRGEVNKTIINGKITYFKEFYNLSAGNYIYRWYVIDVIGTVTSTSTSIFEIKKTPASIKTLQGEANSYTNEKSRTYTLNTISNVTSSINVTGKSVSIVVIDPAGNQVSDSAVDKIQLFKKLDVLGLYSIVSTFAGDANTESVRVNKWMVSYDPNNIERTPPSFTFQGENATKVFEGEKILFWINVSDSSLVDYVRLLTNHTGNYVENQSVFVNEPSRNATFEFLVPSQTAGKTIGWKMVANDSFNNIFTSQTLAFSVYDISDTNYDRQITLTEIIYVIDKYYQNKVSLPQLLASIDRWQRSGSY